MACLHVRGDNPLHVPLASGLSHVQVDNNGVTILYQTLHIMRYFALAYRIGISEILTWDRKSYLTHVILPRFSREAVHWLFWNSCDIFVK